ncbi:MAG: Lrp/AsnC family transcriptional regulator [Lachnospiraceae bacterium]|nr:Lrp/AsnC family transcriptional regulator [Lachnospiraceae bacterium]MBQ9608477.1 Lrp/AsnC family transcriptional regulator [Lachnospiraceae bacterium]
MEKRELIYYKLDEVDEKILEILQDNARTSLKDIAEQVFLSPTAVGTRIDRMLDEGVLEGFTTRLNPEAMGHYVKAFINLQVEPAQREEFYEYIDGVLNVIECNCVTGDYSMLIEVRFPTTTELDHFIVELQRFGKTKTQIVFSTCVKHRCRYWREDSRTLSRGLEKEKIQ